MDIMKFELTTIQENAFIYETHLRNVNRRRELWSKDTRQKIMDTLEAVRDNFRKIDWLVEVDDLKKNYETVGLRIADAPSGISSVSKDDVKDKEYTKTGGSLGFSQMVSGKIKVWIEYPFFNGIQEVKEPRKILVTIEPSYVNESLIAGYVQQFLHEITVYESGT